MIYITRMGKWEDICGQFGVDPKEAGSLAGFDPYGAVSSRGRRPDYDTREDEATIEANRRVRQRREDYQRALERGQALPSEYDRE